MEKERLHAAEDAGAVCFAEVARALLAEGTGEVAAAASDV